MRLNKIDKYVLEQIDGANGIDWSALRGRVPMYNAKLDLSLRRLLDGHTIVKIIASYKGCRNEIYFPAGTSFEFKSE